MSFLRDLGAIIGEVKSTTQEIKKIGVDALEETITGSKNVKNEVSKVTDVLGEVAKKINPNK